MPWVKRSHFFQATGKEGLNAISDDLRLTLDKNLRTYQSPAPSSWRPKGSKSIHHWPRAARIHHSSRGDQDSYHLRSLPLYRDTPSVHGGRGGKCEEGSEATGSGFRGNNLLHCLNLPQDREAPLVIDCFHLLYNLRDTWSKQGVRSPAPLQQRDIVAKQIIVLLEAGRYALPGALHHEHHPAVSSHGKECYL
eukprot:scaffold2693_cov178-Ochromonas_danica.AAC.1